MTNTYLITGGCGFIGHHFVEHFWKNDPGCNIIIIDKLNYSGRLERLRDINVYPNNSERLKVLTLDFTVGLPEGILSELQNVNVIIHMGAETHVDNSIKDPKTFVKANVLGTHHMLELARKLPRLRCFFQFSTDEVYGPAAKNVWFKETDNLNPNNPYAATKAGADMLCLAYANTYGIPITITRCMNVFGERQHVEKFIPLCINKILHNETVQVHADSKCQASGSRFYIHARNVANAYEVLMNNNNKQEQCEVFNIVGEKEVTNEEVVLTIARILGKVPRYELVDFHSSRPGHDLRYAMSGEKMKERFGWTPPKTFEESLEKTIQWYLSNPKWLIS